MGDSVTRKSQLTINPQNADICAMPIARPAMPFFVREYPSKQSAAEAGVPGVFQRIALTEPPCTAEIKTAANMSSPCSAEREKESGTRIATAIVAVSPGRKPTIYPPTTETTVRRIMSNVKKL